MTTAAPTTHHTAETRFVEGARIDFAYRRFGQSSAVPLVILQHFRGNLDNWDPALTDALAAEREVILVDYAGVSSTGQPSSAIAATARQIIAFITALGLEEIDLLGFSIGGFVVQEIALVRPALVRRLILAATGPKGAPGCTAGVRTSPPPRAARATRKPAVHHVRAHRDKPRRSAIPTVIARSAELLLDRPWPQSLYALTTIRTPGGACLSWWGPRRGACPSDQGPDQGLHGRDGSSPGDTLSAMALDELH